MAWLFRQVQSALRRATEEALAPLDLTPSQAELLSALANGSRLSNAGLARAAFVTPQSMVELLRSLETRGLIVRRPDPSGGRAMPAELTPQGARQLLAVHLAMRAVEDRLLRDLEPDERARLRQLLERCLASLTESRIIQ
ncbi:Transcriptional regulator [Candidatus Sulfopaludibacter sp. SbA6]|nr:Transcriptional regulator [Candidatus Sulfopaludibacter sp. SbA6]